MATATATKSLTTNAGQKKRGGNNNPTGKGKFTGADDPRRNNAGQRDKQAVQTTIKLRHLLITIGEEELKTADGRTLSRFEAIARRLFVMGGDGDLNAIREIFDRIWGKVPQQFNVRDLSAEQIIAALAATDEVAGGAEDFRR